MNESNPDAETVERVARAIAASQRPSLRWEDYKPETQGMYRLDARAAIAAALAAAAASKPGQGEGT